ncbi:MAG: 2-oxoacid:acceptor oxidoreductase subunit alpha [Rhodospirillaceae bacterium]|jgi:2-oxoglutarate/2-oxoacid ferredoxin oxidoreductase subunit alpha|nr:2-oxoacid:acceptor oxidoreductase subunit alpha [Rhodospirillaceae bacterium]MBT6137382.1 2-oxoacid:acceptor oxidoreductase subunit alpha [Rhodospirillaceae bacterium]
MTGETKLTNLQGNHACALAAISAGCDFYAGYPITPSSEVAERMSVELPRIGGTFIQMEDEIASMAAVLGAAMGGAVAMTATSGPGFSLKQENIGLGIITETPCVIVNVMRGGPSTGMPTRPGQGDIMQARWGTHGDHPVVALAPASVAEVWSETRRAFAIAEAVRTPVILLIDEVVGHLVETVAVDANPEPVTGRVWAEGDPANFQPYEAGPSLVPAMAKPGDGRRAHMTGLTHGPDGFPTQDPATASAMLTRLFDKIETHNSLIERFEAIDCEDADIVIVAYGISARAARRATSLARKAGLRVGLFRPVTLWPFPETAFRTATKSAGRILVAEMNAGQLRMEIERLTSENQHVEGVNRFDGEPITPEAILTAIDQSKEQAA